MRRWFFASLVIAFVVGSFLAGVRADTLDARAAYAAYVEPRPHPYYVVGLPFTRDARTAAASAICRLDEHGFREPGIGAAGDRPLAFLLGGSLAFGVMASSDAATIASALNRLQSEVFFVSAGMPGATSTQDLLRLTIDVADHRPRLIVALNGDGDVASLVDAGRRRRQLPIGTPAAFSAMLDTVDRPRGVRRLLAWPAWWRTPLQAAPLTPADWLDAAALYAGNVERMAAVSRTLGAQFAWVMEPRRDPDFDRFRRAVSTTVANRPPLRDAEILWSPLPQWAGFGEVSDRSYTEMATTLLSELRARRLIGASTP